jgi:hypothetical protein
MLWNYITLIIVLGLLLSQGEFRTQVSNTVPIWETCLMNATQSGQKFLLEELMITQLVKFSNFYGTRRIITVFTGAHEWSLSWARWVQSASSHSISLRYVLHSEVCSRSYFPTKFLYAFLTAHKCTWHSPWFECCCAQNEDLTLCEP